MEVVIQCIEAEVKDGKKVVGFVTVEWEFIQLLDFWTSSHKTGME